MPFPRVFVSSTYVDLVDARNAIESCLLELHFQPTCMERGGISYDHRKAMDYSCYDAVKECDMMILVIGGRYGSPASDNWRSSDGIAINSITKTEYLEALAAGIKVMTFIKESVMNEYFTFQNQPKSQRKSFRPAMVDNTAIYQLIYEILLLDKNNEIVRYENTSEIIEKIQKEVALLAGRALKEEVGTDPADTVFVNAYKLFYYRRQNGLSINKLSEKARVKKQLIQSIEKVKAIGNEENAENTFRPCPAQMVKQLEEALGCPGELVAGKPDDMLSQYVNYYYANRGKAPTKSRGEVEIELFPRKAIVFDFDGTLTRAKMRTTWELIWEQLGYSVNDCAYYHRQFSNGTITHEQWCEITTDKFRERGLNEEMLNRVAENIELVEDVEETIDVLVSQGIEVYILSGSIEQIIQRVLGEKLVCKFTSIHANSFKFSNQSLSYINGTRYDFEGKKDFMVELINKRHFEMTDLLFVGNSSNDRWVSQSGVATLCVNPHFTDGNDVREWLYCLREMESLKEILQFIKFDSLV